jgi:hypothetical protein
MAQKDSRNPAQALKMRTTMCPLKRRSKPLNLLLISTSRASHKSLARIVNASRRAACGVTRSSQSAQKYQRHAFLNNELTSLTKAAALNLQVCFA